ncbi:hypothetical protein B0T25DRAFT_151612 [Lasiosphaeria hispida]|uniref:Uncharacterized protein n=1 Tax=Lasiosphaeria hispida TaxID=260671 RepID=A0AAJ0MFZ4_9PEZI|nr:hypothetical protein B0T25DRAFT_151612 [Lasiosphaeria hispida]
MGAAARCDSARTKEHTRAQLGNVFTEAALHPETHMRDQIASSAGTVLAKGESEITHSGKRGLGHSCYERELELTGCPSSISYIPQLAFEPVGGGKKDWWSTSAFSSGSWARLPSGLASAGVQVGDTSCLFLAHLTSFQRLDGDADASSTLWRWVLRTVFWICRPFLLPFLLRACR